MAITIQNTVRTGYQTGFPGMLADGNTQARPSGTVEPAAGIPFGSACFQGAADRGVTSTPGTKFKGIAIASAGIVAQIVGNTIGAADTYAQYQNISMADMGDIFVTFSGAAAVGAQVYATPTPGVFSTTATNNTAIPATLLETITAAGVAKIRVVQQ